MPRSAQHPPTVLFVGLDDALEDCSTKTQWQIVVCGPADAEDALTEQDVRVVVLAYDDDAATLVESAHEHRTVAIIAVEGDAHLAMQRLHESGADAFVTRPVDPDHLRRLITQELRTPRAHRRPTSTPIPRIVGGSGWIRSICSEIGTMAPSNAPVLICGESGTGKEIAARAIHSLSPRRNEPLIVVNCGAIPPELVESELFGHEKGAFTGADQRSQGCFEAADGGTLFLDEIGELLPRVQVKLLRAVQDGRFTRVGGTERVEVDVRIIAATNRNLQTEIEAGRFREDLFYRLNVLNVRLPSLRERPNDVRPLWEYFVGRASEEEGTARLQTSEEVFDHLERYDWPGNVRELKNVARRVVARRPAGEVTPESLPDAVLNRRPEEELRIPGMTLEEIERHAILTTYRATGSARETAKILDVSERKIFYRLKQYREEDSEAFEDERPTLALVEDDFDLRGALTDVLSRSYRVRPYASAEALLEELDDARPDVIVTDVRLPEADGLELLERLTARCDVPVILISAFADDEARDDAIRKGAVAFLDKPVDTIRLGRVLERATVNDAKAPPS